MTASNSKPSFASIAAIGTDITVNPVPQPDPASIISASNAPTKSFSEIQQSDAISSEDVKQRVNTTAKAHMDISGSAFAGSSSASSTAASTDGNSTSTASSGGNMSPVPAVSVAKLAPAPLKNPWKTESIKKELSIVMQSQPGLPTPAESKDMRPSLPVLASISLEPISALAPVAPKQMKEASTVAVAAAGKPSSTPAKAITTVKPKSTKPAWKKPDIIEKKIDLRQEAKAPVKSSEKTKDEPTQASTPSDNGKQQQSLRKDKPKESSKPVPLEDGKKDADAKPSSKTTSPSIANANASSEKKSAPKKNGRESMNKNGNNASSSDTTRRPHNNNNKSTKKSSSNSQDHSHSPTNKNSNKSKKTNNNANANNQKKNKNKKQGKRKNKVKKQKDVHYIPTPEEYEALKKSAVQQVEYFFSVDELIKNIYMRKQMDVEGYLPAAIVFNFPTVLLHYIPYYDLLEAVQKSEVVEVDMTNECLRLKGGEEACKKWLFPNKDGTLGVAKWIKEVVEVETEDTNTVAVEDGSTKESSEDASETAEQKSAEAVSEKSLDEKKVAAANDKPELTMTDSDESEITQ